jgi:plastocyanin
VNAGDSTQRRVSLVSITLIAIAFAAAGFMIARQVAIDSQGATASQYACEGTCVALMADKAEPDTLTVKAGEYVQFNSADGKAHSLSLGLGGKEHQHKGPFSSGAFQADEAWRVQFKEPGTYTFHDHLNPNINVLVVVYQEGTDKTTF